MKKISILILSLFLLSFISAECNEGQIDINSDSSEKLMDIIWVGNSTANKIIYYRQNNLFDSVDELANISGIKAGKLQDIKSQGRACVSLEEINGTSEANETKEENKTIIQQTSINQEPKVIEKPITAEVIYLNSKPKSIKTEVNVLKSDNIAIYGLIGFCILLGTLFAIRKIKRPKTEFEIIT